jgi:hypothetical protein
MKLKLKIDSAASTGNHGNYMKYANVHWLWWQQHLIVRDLREHCLIEEVTDSVRTVLIPSLSDPTFPFRLCRRCFPIKTLFAMTISKVQSPNMG